MIFALVDWSEIRQIWRSFWTVYYPTADTHEIHEKCSKNGALPRETKKKLDFSKNQLPKNFGRLFLVCPDIFRRKEKSIRLRLHRTAVSELFGSIRPKSVLRHHPAEIKRVTDIIPNFDQSIHYHYQS